MSNDKELLELAAKAYWGDEIDDVVSVEYSESDEAILYTHGDNQDHNGCDQTLVWNTLRDDGDVFRLAVKLDLFGPCHNKRLAELLAEENQLHGHRPTEVRRAFTRLAAEIGRTM